MLQVAFIVFLTIELSQHIYKILSKIHKFCILFLQTLFILELLETTVIQYLG